MTGRAAVWMLIACCTALAQLQLTDPTGAVCNQQSGTDLGSIGMAGTTSSFQIKNTGTTGVTLSTLAIQGAGFSLASKGTLPLTLLGGASMSFTVTLAPTSIGSYSGWLSINQDSYLLFANVLPFHIAVTPGTLQSGQTAMISIPFDVAPGSAGNGTIEWDFQADPGCIARGSTACAGDTGMGILLPSNTCPESGAIVPPRGQVAFQIGAGQNAPQFTIDSCGGTAQTLEFQSGSTAGTILFTVALGTDSAQASLPIAPATVWMDTINLTTGPGAITLDVSGFDNTRSASQATFTFLDSSGKIVGGGPVSADVSSDFEQYFQNPSLGGVFKLMAAFPVTGDTSQVNSVKVGFTNSAGTSAASAPVSATIAE